MKRAAIFDMDGVLLDSEPWWQDAEMEVFGRLGRALTREECREFTGVPVDDVVAHRYAEQPWSGPDQRTVAREIVDGVIARVGAHGVPLPGAWEAMAVVRKSGAALGLASSSSMRLITAVLKRFAWEDAFDVVHSSESEPYGKPHPAVFLTAAQRLGVPPASCVVVEDSFHGLIAAKAARMRTVVVPSAAAFDDPRFVIADIRLRSLTDFTAETWRMLMER